MPRARPESPLRHHRCRSNNSVAKPLGALLTGEQFLLALVLLWQAHTVLAAEIPAPDCRLSGEAESVRLRRAIDGDTLLLEDGRKLRLIGINTPELAHDQASEQAGAGEALRFASHFLASRRLYIQQERDAHDRHGRLLAHVYREDGASLEYALLRAGLALFIAIPPNIARLDCLVSAESEARRAAEGLWGSGVYRALPATQLGAAAGGFQLLRGRVSEVVRSRDSWWIEMGGAVVLRIHRSDWRYFDWLTVVALKGREIEVRGWLVSRGSPVAGRAPWVLQVHHPRVLSSENL